MSERSTSEVVGNMSEQVGALVRDELRTAFDELKSKAQQAGIGGALGAAATVLALYAGAACVAGCILLLARMMPAWLAAMLTGMALSCTAAIIGLAGASQLQEAASVPAETLAGVEEDVDAARQQAAER